MPRLNEVHFPAQVRTCPKPKLGEFRVKWRQYQTEWSHDFDKSQRINWNRFAVTGKQPDGNGQIVVIDFDAQFTKDEALALGAKLPGLWKLQWTGKQGVHAVFWVTNDLLFKNSQPDVQQKEVPEFEVCTGKKGHADIRGDRGIIYVYPTHWLGGQQYQWLYTNETPVCVPADDLLMLVQSIVPSYHPMEQVDPERKWIPDCRMTLPMRQGFTDLITNKIDMSACGIKGKRSKFIIFTAVAAECFGAGYSDEETIDLLSQMKGADHSILAVQVPSFRQNGWRVYGVPSAEYYQRLFPTYTDAMLGRNEFDGRILDANTYQEYIAKWQSQPPTPSPDYLAYKYWEVTNVKGWSIALWDGFTRCWVLMDEYMRWKQHVESDIQVDLERTLTSLLGVTVSPAVLASYERIHRLRSDESFYAPRTTHGISFRNLYAEIGTGIQRDNLPSDGIVFQIPHLFDPHALCPTLIEFFTKVIPDPIVRDAFFAFIASLFVGYNANQWILMLLGKKGGTGKGTTIDIIESLIGIANVIALKLQDFKDPHGTMHLPGKIMLKLDELQAKEFPLSEVKTISGGGTINVNPKGERPYSYLPLAQIVIISNSPPDIPLEEEAFWRRPIIVNYDQPAPYTPEEYKSKKERMLQEMPGFINLLLPYLDPGRVLQIRSAYAAKYNTKEMYDQSTIVLEYQFFDQCIRPDSSKAVTLIAIMEAYQKFYLEETGKALEIDKSFQIKIGKMLGVWASKQDFKMSTDRCIVKGQRTRKYNGIMLHMTVDEQDPSIDDLMNQIKKG